ncbi:MAG: phosphate signaling complex protein PhoU [Anaerolineae bacterium]
MAIRQRFERQLDELREDVLKMGSMVEAELALALEAFDRLSSQLADQVHVEDTSINQQRFQIEEKCFALIVTQQPAARDLRAVVAVMNMIVDLERMGDQAKGIAKVVPHVIRSRATARPPEIAQMGELVSSMLRQAMTAYAHDNVDLAAVVAQQDDEVDALYAAVFAQIMGKMAKTKNPDKVESSYETLRVARELERFGDLATNVAERVIYLVTGYLHEVNVDRDGSAG